MYISIWKRRGRGKEEENGEEEEENGEEHNV